MKPRLLILAAAAAVLLVALAWFAKRQQHELEAGLPPRTLFAEPQEAFIAAQVFARINGGTLYPVVGTGSMAPFLPAARAGLDPRQTVVAFVVSERSLGFADIARGNLCIYSAEWTPGLVAHCAAQKDGGGWIMSGIHNSRSEPEWRVTPKNFVALVAHVFTWPQGENP